ncbi:MAG: electron transfer flavoprotein subunit beta [Rhodoglobus sp.]|nr:electron transfer flavoprotein subunit beta [Rhodoglobus sp.]
MKIIVLVKQVPDTWGERTLDSASGRIDRSNGDQVFDESGERALEVALRHREASGADIVAMTMGPPSAAEVLRKALAMGADSAVHVLDDALAGSDLSSTSAALAAAIKLEGFDLVIAGNESTDGRGGMIPAMVAEHLGVAHATFLNSTVIDATTVRGERGTESGTLEVHAGLPAVISVTERSPEARFPGFKGIMGAKKKPLVQRSLAELAPLDGGAKSVVLSVVRRPARSAGLIVTDDGTAAKQLADFLVTNRLA